MPSSIARRRTQVPLDNTGWVPMRLGATALRGYSMGRGFRCCWRRQRHSLDVDGGAGGRAGRLSWRPLAAGRDGSHGFVFVAAVAVFADYRSSPDAVKRIAADFRVGHVSDVGAIGLDERGAGVVVDGWIVAGVGFRKPGESIRDSRHSLVLDPCTAESEAGVVRAVLDFDS